MSMNQADYKQQCLLAKSFNHWPTLLQVCEDQYHALSCRSVSAKEPLIIELFCGTRPIAIRHPMTLCHPLASQHPQPLADTIRK